MELTTIAKPYANAIFEIAQQNEMHSVWRSILEVGASIADDTKMRAFIASPNATKAVKSKAIIEIYQSAMGRMLNAQEIAFVDLLLKNNRIGVLPSILALFDAKCNLGSDAKVFQVTSAYKLSAAEEKKITRDLSDKYKTTVSIDTEIDKNLVGGVVIKEGDKVTDLSIQARVNGLGSSLSIN
ncbi:MAG: ATP synthase subunit delta [Catillopecten margaritatus gill symbiont]|uniref:ATP synthase subunit delta n=1 Tax=Catillopecten margaritatus gill symbiont TaxID=3083288 RepID=A0AAU6PGN8_9GAMM